MDNVKKILLVFLFAFNFNIIWEKLHSYLYIHYQGMEIINLILLRAALFDATFISVLGVIFLHLSFLKSRLWLAFVIGSVFAIGLEMFALQTGRWAYNEMMPIIPYLKVGLTPSVQLGLLAYVCFKIVFDKR